MCECCVVLCACGEWNVKRIGVLFLNLLFFFFFLWLDLSIVKMAETSEVRRSRSPLRESPLNRNRAQSAPELPHDVHLDYSNLSFEFIPGKRANSKLLHTIDEQQLYRRRVKHGRTTQYDCYINTCNAKVFFDDELNSLKRKEKHDRHNHGANDMISTLQLSESIKKRCRSAAMAGRNENDGNVRDIFHNTIRE